MVRENDFVYYTTYLFIMWHKRRNTCRCSRRGIVSFYNPSAAKAAPPLTQGRLRSWNKSPLCKGGCRLCRQGDCLISILLSRLQRANSPSHRGSLKRAIVLGGEKMWILLAFGSAFFAGITAILAKCGIRKTDSYGSGEF